MRGPDIEAAGSANKLFIFILFATLLGFINVARYFLMGD